MTTASIERPVVDLPTRVAAVASEIAGPAAAETDADAGDPPA